MPNKFSKYKDINPEDIFMDSVNLPGYAEARFEGRMERPMGELTFLILKVIFVAIAIFLVSRLTWLEVKKGAVYALVSENNRLNQTVIFSDRGVIYDRTGLALATNSIKEGTTTDFAARLYAPIQGAASVLGYLKYPSKDTRGYYYDTEYHGQAGVEKFYNTMLAGVNGSKLVETDALGNVTSEGSVNPPVPGDNLTLALDAKLNQALYKNIASLAADKGFTGGAGVIMDVRTGEVLALTSFPEYDSNIVTSGLPPGEISKLITSPQTPFLNRAVSGLYTPGSIVKPIIAIAALNEKVIDPLKQILSTGSISLPNPYDPSKPSVFRDWRANGLVDMRGALAVSSDVYFYEIGGGFQGQKGLGITNIDKYFTNFGLTEKTWIDLPSEEEGYIASVAWKEENFPDDPTWRVGNTYHTAIGQYGTQVTPVQAVRFVSAIANGGTLLVPQVVYKGIPKVLRKIDLPAEYYQVIHEGMRQSVTSGVAASLNMSDVKVAAKTGTAELGSRKQFVNSWVTGFFPYDNPRYAFAVLMEKGPVSNLVGAPYVMRQVLDWMALYTPEYLE